MSVNEAVSLTLIIISVYEVVAIFFSFVAISVKFFVSPNENVDVVIFSSSVAL